MSTSFLSPPTSSVLTQVVAALWPPATGKACFFLGPNASKKFFIKEQDANGCDILVLPDMEYYISQLFIIFRGFPGGSEVVPAMQEA